MPTAAECICCCEVEKIVDKLERDLEIACITDHEGFGAVCLNVWVLQAAYFTYRQRYGTHNVQRQPLHEEDTLSCVCVSMPVNLLIAAFDTRQYRFIAYRQLTTWCWGWLGRSV